MTSNVLQRLQQSFNPPDDLKLKLEEYRREIQKLTFKKFNNSFFFKAVIQIPAEKYPAFVEKLQKRLELTNKIKKALLDALDCGDGQENVETFQYKDGKGEIYRGGVIAVNKDGKLDVAYAVYNMTFELAEKEANDRVFKWWSYVPIGWEYKKEVQTTLNADVENTLSEWCRLQLCDRFVQECSKNETKDDEG